jgi:hypothetical protein
MTTTIGTLTFEDYNGEKSTTKVNLPDLAAGGTNFANISTDFDEIGDAIKLVQRGRLRQRTISIVFGDDAAAVDDIEAVREGKWLVTYRDTTPYLGAANTVDNPGFNQLFTFEIPCADRTLLPANEDELDLTQVGAVADLVTALEANIRSPYNKATAPTVTPTNVVTSIRYVGRNN